MCADWYPERYRDVLPKGAESWFAINTEDNILVVVVHRSDKIDWGNYQNLFNQTYDLILIKWDKHTNALFVYSSDYDGLRTDKLAKAITEETAELVHGPAIFNILNNVELPLVKNLGSSRIGAISFTSYFGPNVTEGLASIEKAESSLNNIACLGYEDGNRVLWGGTQRKGKIWQHKSGTISEWIDWCTRTWTKVASEDELDSNITRDFLRPEKLVQPYSSHPIAVQWGEQTQMGYSDKQFLVFGDVEIPIFLIDLEVGEVGTDGSIDIQIVSDGATSTYRLRISSELSGGYSHNWISGPRIWFKKSNSPAVPLVEHLVTDPFIVRYADGTHSYNCYHIPVRLDAGTFPRDRLEIWDWSGIPLNKESINKAGDRATIQYRAFEHIQNDHDVVFNDDGNGEAADLVGFKEADEGTIKLCLVHCKSAYEGRVSSDIRNFYALCGQAQKSAAVKHGGIPKLYFDLKRRNEAWMRDGASRFLKGDIKLLSYFKEKARRSKLEFEVILVQPGVSTASVTSDILALLATTELFLIKTTQAKLRIAVSE